MQENRNHVWDLEDLVRVAGDAARSYGLSAWLAPKGAGPYLMVNQPGDHETYRIGPYDDPIDATGGHMLLGCMKDRGWNWCLEGYRCSVRKGDDGQTFDSESLWESVLRAVVWTFMTDTANGPLPESATPLSSTKKEAEKRTSAEWAKDADCDIVDPDGWREKDSPDFFKDPITKEEFQRRLMRCTVAPRGSFISPFPDAKKEVFTGSELEGGR
jgi:hypothetical protein